MRILIVGAGIAGMTLAALLDQRGMKTSLIERAPNFDHAGYMLALWPLGSRVLHGLGLYERFAAESVAGNQYEVCDNQGELVKDWSMEPITERFGPYLSCTRSQLIKLLHDGLSDADIRFNTSIEALEQKEKMVEVTFSDGSRGTFDLVVGADGLHSRVRRLVFGEQPYFHTGWGGWVWWADLASVPAKTFIDYWGVGRFVGAYPTGDGAGIFVGAPLGDNFERPGAGRRERLRERFAGMGARVDAWLNVMPPDDAEMFFWKLSDVRSEEWVRGRVVLLGDAAAAFLPTAGVGASMAMESAAVLADELSRMDTRFVERSLSFYVQRRRSRVESIQNNSRSLARTMFVKSATVAHLRNLVTKFFSLEQLLSSIEKAFNEPI